MRLRCTALLVALAGTAAAYFPENFDEPLEVVAFGSCNRDDLPQPLWPEIAAQDPDLWIWAGDNVYVDWYEGEDDRAGMSAAEWAVKRFDAQFDRPDYRTFRAAFPIVGTWDDHDYGKNNAGAAFALKEVTKTLLLDFLEVPADAPLRGREGVYQSYTFGPEGKQVKILLLDNRYFMSGPESEDPALLGEAQRAWLEAELRESTAGLHLIVSGIQVLSEEHRWDRWTKFPGVREWLIDFVVEERIPGVIFLSGDRHIHELSRMEVEGLPYPLIDLTSSGLTHAWTTFEGEPNRHRVGEVVKENGYGLLRIDWDADPLAVDFKIRTAADEPALSFRQSYPRR